MSYHRKARLIVLVGFILVLAQAAALAHATEHLLGMDDNPCPACLLKKRLDHPAVGAWQLMAQPAPADNPPEAGVPAARSEAPLFHYPRAPPPLSLA